MRVSKVLASLVSGVLLAAGLSAVGAGSAVASATSPEFIGVTQEPEQLIFDSPTEHLKLVQEMSDPSAWSVADATAYVCASEIYENCDHPSEFAPITDWLKLSDERKGPGAQRFLTFEGDIPNWTRHFTYYFKVTYDIDGAAGSATRTVNSYTTNVYNGTTYYGFGYVYGQGDTRVTIDGPTSITQGASLTLHGTVTCYGTVGYKAPDYAWVSVAYQLPGSTQMVTPGGTSSYDPATGAWSQTILSVGATADWYARTSGNGCRYATTAPAHRVTAGSGTPPPPAALPGAPGVSVGQVTPSTAALAWSTPGGAGASTINGYRFGWTSDNGQPVPSWEQTYTLGQLVGNNPFVMTNLCAGCTYTMWVQAINPVGEGPRTSVQVTTKGTPPPVVQPPVVVVTAPSAPRRLSVRARNHGALVGWLAPLGGVDAYQVKQTGPGRNKAWIVTSTSKRVRSLVNGKRYWFKVRAHNQAGWGPWTAPRSVKPRR